MTTASDTPRPSLWGRFSGWRRGRPFWGGLITLLAALEIFSSTQGKLGDMVIKVGIEGMQAYVIPAALIFAAFLAWFTPAQRHFYGLLTVLISVYSLIGVNFGGWFVGFLLGVIGGSLIFAWTPRDPKPAVAEATEGDVFPEDDDHSPRHALDDVLGDDSAEPAVENPYAPRPEVPAQRDGSDDEPAEPRSRRGRGGTGAVAAMAIPLLLVVVGSVALRAPESAYAAGCPTAPAPRTTATTAPAPQAPSGGSPTGAAAPKAATPSASSSPAPNVLQQIWDGITGLFGGGSSPKAAAPSSSAAPTAGATATPGAPAGGSPTATAKPVPNRTLPSCPAGKPATASPSPSHARILAAAAGDPPVAKRPGYQTADTITMINLVFQGVVDLPQADGSTLKVLKFTMDQATNDNFNLHVYGPKDVDISSKQLIVKQNVSFYTARFRGNLFGLIPVDYTPSNLPPGIPLPLVFFTNAKVDLAWVNTDILTGMPLVTRFSA